MWKILFHSSKNLSYLIELGLKNSFFEILNVN